ncbi:histone-lysine N-methyltransferase EHMT1a isoform X2 [Brachyhypopomus gauderio]
MSVMAKPKRAGMDRAGNPSRRGRKPKPKPMREGSEVEEHLPAGGQHEGPEAGLQFLSAQAAQQPTASLTSTPGSEGPVQAPQKPLKGFGSSVTACYAAKTLQGSSGSSDAPAMERTGPERPDPERADPERPEEARAGATPLQSRWAWKTMARAAPPPDALKILNAERRAPVRDGEELERFSVPPQRAKGPAKPPAVVRRKRRRMGLYNFVPKKKTKVSARSSLSLPSANGQKEASHGLRGVQLQLEQAFKPRAKADSQERLSGRACGGGVAELRSSKESSKGPDDVCEEFTELPLHSVAPDNLLVEIHTGLPEDKENMEAEELLDPPLCSCRMEAPRNQDVVTLAEGKCMAVENLDGKLNLCRRLIHKQEMMRPSLRIPLLVLCEDHRAGMVKHQSCPGCGFFCRAGTFMECQPDGHISHRFHRACATLIRGQLFCPHCGEEASQAKEVTVPRPEPAVAPAVVGDTGPSEGRDATTTLQRCVNLAPPCGPVEPGSESLETVLEALEDGKYKRSKFPPKQLYYSARRGELQRVTHMLVEGADPNLQVECERRRTALHAAAAAGHREVCHILVQAGANLDMCDEQQRTPLMDACENNRRETVEYLLKAGACVTHRDTRGLTCLHMVSRGGHVGVLQHLLTTTAVDINCKDDGGWSPITWATENLHKEVVKLLIAKGADIHMRDKEENICLHWAAFAGSEDVARLLLENGSDLHAANVHEDTPLHVAVRQNQLDCVMLFLSRGADVNLVNRDGETPLDCCNASSKVWAVLSDSKKLTDARRTRESQGERPLCRDLSRGYEEVPVTCVNGVDQEACPNDFKYVPENCFTAQVNVDENITHLQHCTCKDDCSSSSCICGQLSIHCWYDREGRLLQEFSREDPPFLFECNHACSCWRTCRNRVVQNRMR